MIVAEKQKTDLIFETLRDRICLLDYPPGTVLRETELAQEFGISRTPIRGILQRLKHGHLVMVRDGVGTIVTDLSQTELSDIYEMRLKMAELIGVLSPNPVTLTHKNIAAELLQRAKQLCLHYTASEYWHINHALHALIADLIGNSVLQETWDQLYFRSARFWYRYASHTADGIAQELVAELSEIARALQKNDIVAIGYIQRNFIAFSFTRLKSGF